MLPEVGTAKYDRVVRGTRPVNVSLPRKMAVGVKRAADAHGVSVSDVIAHALDSYLPSVIDWQPILLPGSERSKGTS